MAADRMPAKLLRLINAFCASAKTKVEASESGWLPFEIRSDVCQECTVSPTLLNHIIEWILGQALHSSPGIRVSTNAHVPDLDYADDNVVLPWGDARAGPTRQ